MAIHGIGSSSNAWKLLQAKLDSRIELITLDLPGHGESTLEAETKMTPEYLGNLVVQTLKNNGLEKYSALNVPP